VKFTNAVVTTALCCPSRSSILKGEYAHTTGVLTNSQPLGGALDFDDSSSLATWLHGQGYRTGLYGKYLNGYRQLWGPAPAMPYVPPGWDEWHAFQGTKYYDYVLIENGAGYDHAAVSYPSGCPTYTACPGDAGNPCASPQNYSTDIVFQKTLDFLDTQPTGRPFFLYVAPFAPHGPACPAEPDVESFTGIAPWRPPNWNEADVSDKPAWVQNLCPMTTNKINNIDTFRRMQLESLQAVDRWVGAIMDKLRQIGQDANTLVLFTGDNGFAWGAHCHRPKRCPYEECMRVPLIVRYPLLAPRHGSTPASASTSTSPSPWPSSPASSRRSRRTGGASCASSTTPIPPGGPTTSTSSGSTRTTRTATWSRPPSPRCAGRSGSTPST